MLAVWLYGTAGSQTFAWIDGEETGYNLNPSAVNYTVCVAPDQTIWFGGLKEKLANYYQMMGNNILIRYDALGNRLGTYMINGTLVINAMKCDPAGHLYIAGDFMDGDIHFWDGSMLTWNGNSINSFVVRVNNQGTVDWSVNLNNARGEYSPVADMAYRNGKLYFANNVWLNSFISTLDDFGNFSVFITETGVGILSGLDFYMEGNLYCTGSCAGETSSFNGVNFPPPTFYNKYLVKYDPTGNPVWVKYSEDVTCILPKVRVDKDNNIYWTGHLNNPCFFDTIALQGPSWVYDFYLIKMTPQGSALWGREVPQVTSGDAMTGPLDIIKVLPDNSVTVGGDTRGMVDCGDGVVTDVGSVNNEAWLINYNSNGVIQWAKIGGGSYTDLKSMDADLSGNLYLTGMGHDTVSFDALQYFRETYYFPYIVKMDYAATNGISGKSADLKMAVIPNPANDIITLSPNYLMRYKVYIIDMQGRTVLGFNNASKINISSLEPGIYGVRVRLDDGSISMGKMVKR